MNLIFFPCVSSTVIWTEGPKFQYAWRQNFVKKHLALIMIFIAAFEWNSGMAFWKTFTTENKIRKIWNLYHSSIRVEILVHSIKLLFQYFSNSSTMKFIVEKWDFINYRRHVLELQHRYNNTIIKQSIHPIHKKRLFPHL